MKNIRAKYLVLAGIHYFTANAVLLKRESSPQFPGIESFSEQAFPETFMDSLHILGHYNEEGGYDVFQVPESDLAKDNLKEFVSSETRNDLSKAIILVNDEHSTELFSELFHLSEFPTEISSVFIFREKALVEKFQGGKSIEESICTVILVKDVSSQLLLQPVLEKTSLGNHTFLVSIHNDSNAVNIIDQYVSEETLSKVQVSDKFKVVLLDEDGPAR